MCRKWPSREWDAEAGTIEVTLLVHEIVIAGPVQAENASVARGFAAEEALKVLADESSEMALEKICDCDCARVRGVSDVEETREGGLGEEAGGDVEMDVETEKKTENLVDVDVGTETNIDRAVSLFDNTDDGQEVEEEPSDLPIRTVREKDIDTDSERGFATAARVRAEQTDIGTGAMLDSDPDSDSDEDVGSISELNHNLGKATVAGKVVEGEIMSMRVPHKTATSTPSMTVSELDHEEVEHMFQMHSAAVSSTELGLERECGPLRG